MSTDRSILLRTRRGDEAAARELWARFSPRMLAYARAVLGRADAASAEDVVQSVFVSILSQPARRLREIDDAAPWLLRLTRNAALNHRRAIRRQHAREARAGLESSPSSSRAGSSSPGAGADDLAAAIDALPRRHREPLILRHHAGLTFDQLALALGINRSTAAARYQAALAVLRRTLVAEATMENHHA